MKKLTLIRHAKSSWKYPNLDDLDRPLNKRGKRDAPMMGKRLAKDKVLPDLMISSPAKRAWKTAKIIAREVGFENKTIDKNSALYEAGVSELIQVIQKIDNKYNDVIIFGHNPGFNSLSHYLTNYEVDNIPTCGVFVIEFNVNSWKEVSQRKGKFISFDYPKKERL
ncbi:histidine phosphatase family protein [candidate division KSB1 bacterium]|nr:histidine phosphatase family protein [candidate division KSB1 bacterium]